MVAWPGCLSPVASCRLRSRLGLSLRITGLGDRFQLRHQTPHGGICQRQDALHWRQGQAEHAADQLLAAGKLGDIFNLVRADHHAVNGVVIGPNQVEDITKLPSREQLIGRVLSLALAPVQRVLSLANAPVGSLMSQLKTISETGNAEGEAEAAPEPA